MKTETQSDHKEGERSSSLAEPALHETQPEDQRTRDGSEDQKKYYHQLLREDLKNCRDEYLKEREFLTKSEYAASQAFDRAMLTLSAGALGFSISLLGFLATAPVRVGLLHTAWLCFAAAVLSTVFSLFMSRISFRADVLRAKTDFRRNSEAFLEAYSVPDHKHNAHQRRDIQTRPNYATRVTSATNLISMVLFILGMSLLIYFSKLNLGTKEKGMSDKKETSAPTTEHRTTVTTDGGDRPVTAGETPPESPEPPIIVKPPTVATGVPEASAAKLGGSEGSESSGDS